MRKTFKLKFTVMCNLNSLPLSFLIFRDIDKIDDLMQDITEQQDVAKEISEAISGPFGETYDEVEIFYFLFHSSIHSLLLQNASNNTPVQLVFS